MDIKLTNKQKRFVEEYCYDWNGTRAYKVAYPNIKTDNAAGVEAYKLLRNPKIQEYITEIQKDIEKQAGISRIMVVKELMAMAFNDVAGIIERFEEDGLNALTEDDKKAIAQFKKTVVEGEGYTKTHHEIKAQDKPKALEMLNKMLGYNEPEKIENTGNVNPIVIRLGGENETTQ